MGRVTAGRVTGKSIPQERAGFSHLFQCWRIVAPPSIERGVLAKAIPSNRQQPLPLIPHQLGV
jgi:hypothetical protein